ncbi:MAG TPA: PKD domain-containing protein [Verrucomicrobiales bacterium]|nr:PKD domain-containing protein [Verrucomicrobiales bacterium]
MDGHRTELVAATYHLPIDVAGVRIDCSITRGFYKNSKSDSWGLKKAARFRLWPVGSPAVRPETFQYPAKQRWFATATQMANVPTFVDGGEAPTRKNIYYHSGLDIGGTEGMVDIVAATDGLVVSAGEKVLETHKTDTPIRPRYDVVYIQDQRGWYYRYSHLKQIDSTISPGLHIKMGDPVGILGKEGGSGGWSHLHFEIKSRQPSGEWGTQAGYAFLWEAYLRQHQPKLIAVARPHHFVQTGEIVLLDASKSWSASGKINKIAWNFYDGSSASGPEVSRSYTKAGVYSEIVKVTDTAGNIDYDFAVVQVIDRDHPERTPPTVHAAYSPTFGIKPGDPVTFKARSFRTTQPGEIWNFGDGSSEVEVKSDGNADTHAADGYATTTHRFIKPGHYIVAVRHTNQFGLQAVQHLHIKVE